MTLFHRELIITLAARHRLPAVYDSSEFANNGGLICYGADEDQLRRATGYVDRILKGEKSADLPVQATDQVRASDQPQDPPRRSASPCRIRCSMNLGYNIRRLVQLERMAAAPA